MLYHFTTLKSNMSHKEIVTMPLAEREKLFSLIARQGFERDHYTHKEVFGDIGQAPFTLKEASEYLEAAEITVRRWVKNGALKFGRIGKNIVFDPNDLKAFKRSRAKNKGGG